MSWKVWRKLVSKTALRQMAPLCPTTIFVNHFFTSRLTHRFSAVFFRILFRLKTWRSWFQILPPQPKPRFISISKPSKYLDLRGFLWMPPNLMSPLCYCSSGFFGFLRFSALVGEFGKAWCDARLQHFQMRFINKIYLAPLIDLILENKGNRTQQDGPCIIRRLLVSSSLASVRCLRFALSRLSV